MDTTSFSVAATASELATKVRAWLGGQTTPDVAPVMYQLETTAATSDKYAVVLAAVYTVGPRSIDDDKISPAGTEEPLLRRAKLLAPPDRVSPAGACPRHVTDLLQRHVSALAAGMRMEEMLKKEHLSFVEEVLHRVNHDLPLGGNSGGGGGLLVYGARVERLAVEVPCDRVGLAVFAEEGAAPTAAYDLHPVVKLEVILSTVPGAVSVSVAGPTQQVNGDDFAGCVAVEYDMQLHGKTALHLKLTGGVTAWSGHGTDR